MEPLSTLTAIEVFFSYSHKDEALRDQLATHLSGLKRQGVIRAWHDRQITAGTEWAGEIDRYLNSAQIILLLISPDFIASDYCYDIEMTRSLERHEAGEARVIPIVLRPTDLRGMPFSKLQALPKDAKPVTSWKDPDEAFLNITQGIRAAIADLTHPPDWLESSGREPTKESTPEEEELRALRSQLLTARSERELKTLLYKTEEFLSLHSITEARLLKDDITRAISYYHEPTMEAPARSIGYGRQPMAIVVLLVLFVLGVIVAILLFR